MKTPLIILFLVLASVFALWFNYQWTNRLDIASVLIASGALVFAFLQHQRTSDSNDIATQANQTAEGALRTAELANKLTENANQTAKKALEEARKANDTAEEANQLAARSIEVQLDAPKAAQRADAVRELQNILNDVSQLFIKAIANQAISGGFPNAKTPEAFKKYLDRTSTIGPDTKAIADKFSESKKLESALPPLIGQTVLVTSVKTQALAMDSQLGNLSDDECMEYLMELQRQYDKLSRKCAEFFNGDQVK